jgi:hypothetical protein
MDGTMLRTADSAANRKHFGASVAVHDRVGSYPQLRAVTLTAIPTHLVRDVEFGPYDVNEMISARQLIPRVPGNSITVFDKGFLCERRARSCPSPGGPVPCLPSMPVADREHC